MSKLGMLRVKSKTAPEIWSAALASWRPNHVFNVGPRYSKHLRHSHDSNSRMQRRKRPERLLTVAWEQRFARAAAQFAVLQSALTHTIHGPEKSPGFVS
jgi:hypothetical protein